MVQITDLRALLINVATELETLIDKPEIAAHPIYPELVALRKHHDRIADELGNASEFSGD